MLPDFPNVKKSILKKLIIPYVKTRRASYLGVLNQMHGRTIHEGNNSLMIRSDGSEDIMNPKTMSGSYSYNNSNIKNMTPEDVFKKMDNMAEEFSIKMSDNVIDKVGTACEETGNVLNLNNQKFSVIHFFELLEKIEIDFDDDNNPIWPSFLIGKNVDPVIITKELEKIQNDKTLRKRFDEIMNKKREEYNARESNRELVR